RRIDHQLAELLVHQGVDAAPLDRDLHVLLARTDILHLDLLIELVGLFFGLGGFVGHFGRFGYSCRGARLLCFRLWFISHGMPPPKVKKAEKVKKARTPPLTGGADSESSRLSRPNKIGCWGSNPRQPLWQRGALRLSYTRDLPTRIIKLIRATSRAIRSA